jgi:hypothetical protein
MNIRDFSQTLQVPGELHSPVAAATPLTLQLTYSKYVPCELEVHGVLTQPGRHPIREWNKGLEVSGRLPGGQVLRLAEPWVQRTRGVEVDIGCTGFTFGMESPVEFDGGRYSVVVAAPYTKAAEIDCQQIPSYLGSIESERTAEDGVKWASPIGEALLADFYHYEPMFAEGEITTRVRVTEIHFRGEIATPLDPSCLVKEVEAAIDEPLSLLSFVSRTPLQWYEIRVGFLPRSTRERPGCEYMRRRVVSCNGNCRVEPLLRQRHLSGGGFERMLDRLKTVGIKERLLRAMTYSVASYGEPTVEAGLGVAYLALEALTSGHSRSKGADRILSGECDLDFRTGAAEFVQNFCEAKGLARDTREQLLANIQGLGRRSLKRSILELVKDTNIGAEDLWPRQTSLADGVGGIVDRRNRFIHEALVQEPPWVHVKDLERVQAIVERSILALLGWDWTHVSGSAYDHRWLAEGEE